MLYVAVAAPEGAVVVRAALPETSVRAALAGLRGRLLAVALAVLALALGASFLVARRISRPLENLRLGAQLFAEGALDYRLHVPDSEETRGLAAAMNAMAAQLGDRLETIRRQRNQTEAILSSMREGVVAVDADRRVITVNEAALRLFRRRAEDVCGRPIQEVLRNPYLQRFLGDVLHDGAPREGEMVLRVGGTERNLHLNGTILRDAAGRKIGAVAVLHDVTRLRRLEHLRRDFVANVSHELRTPVTSIRGFAETLLDEELDPAERRRFLEIVHRQAERLGDLVEDLLALSRIEREVEAEAVRLEPGPVAAVVQGAVEACRPAAKRRRVRLSAECPADLEASMEPRLLEQALVNLLDNAVKYSPEGGEVEVTAAREGGEVVVRVRDQGPGIPREHLPRIFERFYRVDKARSRELGGTGLGLAIVKHVMQAHGGRVTVESEPGKGSVFALHLPG
nr:ATP-binding protein [Dissulfurirhabdus thermomarina]